MKATIELRKAEKPQDEDEAAVSDAIVAGMVSYLRCADDNNAFGLSFPRAFELIGGERTSVGAPPSDPMTIDITIDAPDFLFVKKVDLDELLTEICSEEYSEQSAVLSKLYGQRLRELADKIDPQNQN